MSDDDEPPIPEDVYDVPPPILTDKHLQRDRAAGGQPLQDIYDIPSTLRSGGHPLQDVYDFPREREDRGGDRGEQYIYDVPPQVGLFRRLWGGGFNVHRRFKRTQSAPFSPKGALKQGILDSSVAEMVHQDKTKTLSPGTGPSVDEGRGQNPSAPYAPYLLVRVKLRV